MLVGIDATEALHFAAREYPKRNELPVALASDPVSRFSVEPIEAAPAE
jgi:hypothetical protein